jgi:hypothetical protein
VLTAANKTASIKASGSRVMVFLLLETVMPIAIALPPQRLSIIVPMYERPRRDTPCMRRTFRYWQLGKTNDDFTVTTPRAEASTRSLAQR